MERTFDFENEIFQTEHLSPSFSSPHESSSPKQTTRRSINMVNPAVKKRSKLADAPKTGKTKRGSRKKSTSCSCTVEGDDLLLVGVG
jgi:hypothetical protein